MHKQTWEQTSDNVANGTKEWYNRKPRIVHFGQMNMIADALKCYTTLNEWTK